MRIQRIVSHPSSHCSEGIHLILLKRRKKKNYVGSGKHSTHRLRKRRYLGPRHRTFPPREKRQRVNGDQKGSWQYPVPDLVDKS
eukprot:1148417-Pelagomonas_calceolata.AAC.1